MFAKLGTGELLLILAVALVIFGPTKLPQLARSAGKIVGSMKNYIRDIKEEIEEADKELSNMQKDVEATLNDVNAPLTRNAEPSVQPAKPSGNSSAQAPQCGGV